MDQDKKRCNLLLIAKRVAMYLLLLIVSLGIVYSITSIVLNNRKNAKNMIYYVVSEVSDNPNQVYNLKALAEKYGFAADYINLFMGQTIYFKNHDMISSCEALSIVKRNEILKELAMNLMYSQSCDIDFIEGYIDQFISTGYLSPLWYYHKIISESDLIVRKKYLDSFERSWPRSPLLYKLLDWGY